MPKTRSCPKSFPAPINEKCPATHPYKITKTYKNNDTSECCYKTKSNKSEDTKPAAVDAKPAAVDAKPAAVAIKPAAVAIKPAAVAIKPAAVDAKPAAAVTKAKLPQKKDASKTKRVKRSTCSNKETLVLNEPISEVSEDKIFKSWDKSCYDIDELIGWIISNKCKNKSPYTVAGNTKLWRNKSDFNKIVKHPGIDPNLKGELHNLLRELKRQKSEVVNVIKQNLETFNKIGEVGIILTSDYCRQDYFYSEIVLQELIQMVGEGDMASLSDQNGKTLKSAIAPDSGCLHGRGRNIMGIYLTNLHKLDQTLREQIMHPLVKFQSWGSGGYFVCTPECVIDNYTDSKPADTILRETKRLTHYIQVWYTDFKQFDMERLGIIDMRRGNIWEKDYGGQFLRGRYPKNVSDSQALEMTKHFIPSFESVPKFIEEFVTNYVNHKRPKATCKNTEDPITLDDISELSENQIFKLNNVCYSISAIYEYCIQEIKRTGTLTIQDPISRTHTYSEEELQEIDNKAKGMNPNPDQHYSVFQAFRDIRVPKSDFSMVFQNAMDIDMHHISSRNYRYVFPVSTQGQLMLLRGTDEAHEMFANLANAMRLIEKDTVKQIFDKIRQLCYKAMLYEVLFLEVAGESEEKQRKHTKRAITAIEYACDDVLDLFSTDDTPVDFTTRTSRVRLHTHILRFKQRDSDAQFEAALYIPPDLTLEYVRSANMTTEALQGKLHILGDRLQYIDFTTIQAIFRELQRANIDLLQTRPLLQSEAQNTGYLDRLNTFATKLDYAISNRAI